MHHPYLCPPSFYLSYGYTCTCTFALYQCRLSTYTQLCMQITLCACLDLVGGGGCSCTSGIYMGMKWL